MIQIRPADRAATRTAARTGAAIPAWAGATAWATVADSGRVCLAASAAMIRVAGESQRNDTR